MKSIRHIRRMLIVLVWMMIAVANTRSQQVVHGCVPPIISKLGLTSIAHCDSTKELYLSIGLPFRNKDKLDTLLGELYDPSSLNYKHFLTSDQFTEMFGPTDTDYRSVVEYFHSTGLKVISTHSSRAMLTVSGSVKEIEKNFHVNIGVYKHPTESREFFAPDADPQVKVSVPLLQIRGMDNYMVLQASIGTVKSGLSSTESGYGGSGPLGGYWGYDFRHAYAQNVTLDGSGQTVGLMELENGYYASDITHYEDAAGLPHVQLQNIDFPLFNQPGIRDNSTPGEPQLDIEMVVAMAPNISKVVVFEGLIFSTDAILDSMAANTQIKQFSSSYGLWGGGGGYDPIDQLADNSWIKMAAQGQSYLQATGDHGAFTSYPCGWPSDDQYITLVGGTTLSTNTPGGSWNSEVVWNKSYGATSGGFSNHISLPTWQLGLGNASFGVSSTNRNVPDVSMVADYIDMYFTPPDSSQGHEALKAGTSAAAPLWAGLTALINQQTTNLGLPSVGFVNPALYAIGKGAYYDSAFHDISSGSNNGYSACAGYDLCTGWGTPNGQALINAMALSNWYGNITVNSTLTVPSGGTLTIQPGTTIHFQNGSSLIINGTLAAQGTSSQPITFDRYGSSGTWGGITFNAGSSGSLSYCTIRNAPTGVYSNGFLPSVQHCTITNCSSCGLWVNNAGDCYTTEISYNTFQSNGNGIFLYGSSPRYLHDNQILNNTMGIYCYSSSGPYIYHNVIKSNTSYGIYASNSSPAHLGQYYGDPGHNVIKLNQRGLQCSYSSNVTLGSGNNYCSNSVYSNSTAAIYANSSSQVMAQNDYWGRTTSPCYNAGDFQTYGGATINYTPAVCNDPNPGMGKVSPGSEPLASQPVGLGDILAGGISSDSFFDAELLLALDDMAHAKFDDAIAIYVPRFKRETNPEKRKYVLVQLAECYRTAGKTDFIDMLNTQIRPLISPSDSLNATALMLESLCLITQKNYSQAVAKLQALDNQYGADANIDKHALFNIGYVYTTLLHDGTNAQPFLAILRSKYPHDDLSLQNIDLPSETGAASGSSGQPIAKVEATKPGAYQLFDNYPNPFNPSTQLRFALPEAADISLIVYDVLGREVSVLARGSYEAGYHTATWNGSNMSSGVYFARLQVHDQLGQSRFNAVTKLLLTK